MHNLLIGVQIFCAIVIIVTILMQPSKMDGFNFFSGSGETFYSHNKSKTRESRLARVTIVFSVLFAVVVIMQNLPKFIQ